jgi:starch phosphorylase
MERISDEELWRTHERRRDRLIILARDRIEKRLVRIGMTERREHQAEDALSSDALTICFARRFATYKRGNLLLRKPERLLKLLRDKERPIQLIFAGKAHPHDIPGKEIIKEIIQFAEKNEVTHRIVFIENYDMTVAKYMTSGGDVWLNTPRRPLEASGTSGMKAAMNGVLNCSILDGWWDEAFTPEAGWAIGHGEQYANTEEQDEIESDALYDLLEKDIIPLFYQRSQNSNLPREWVKRMKASMQQMGKSMSSHRMLMDYYNGFYEPAIKNYKGMAKGDYAGAKSLAAYLAKLQQAWKDIEIVSVNSEVKPMVQLGTSLAITASVKLGALSPEEIMVELYRGPVSSEGTLIEENDPQAISPLHSEMKLKSSGGNLYQYEATIECTETGMQGYTVRLLPRHAALIHPYRPGLVKWA